MTDNRNDHPLRAPMAGLLSWILPGLGHLFIRDKARGIILMTCLTATFWTGIAIGGVRETVDPKTRKLWFAAQLCTGGNAFAVLALHRMEASRATTPEEPIELSHWANVDLGVHYTGVAGLLNILVIFDAVARSERRGLRVATQTDEGGP